MDNASERRRRHLPGGGNMKWNERLPGLNTKRADFLADIATAIEQEDGWERAFARATELRVLSVSQWATLLGVHRQSVYARIWRMRLPLPGRVLPGHITPDMIPHLQRAVRILAKGKVPKTDKLQQYGSQELVEYLTGVRLNGDSSSN